MRSARARVPGLTPEFRYHDLRHYYASMLIASGADVKVVQARLRTPVPRQRSTPTTTCGRIPMTARGLRSMP
jgi:integrase